MKSERKLIFKQFSRDGYVSNSRDHCGGGELGRKDNGQGQNKNFSIPIHF